MLKRILATLLLAATTFTAVACSSGSGTTVDDTTSSETTSTVETTTVPPETPDLPDKQFEGEDFVFLASSDSDSNGADWTTYDVYVEEETGDVFNDAVYERNMYISDTYNIFIKEFKPNSTTESAARTAVLANEAIYDAIIGHFMASARLAQEGHTV